MVFCPKCAQIMLPSVADGKMVYICQSDQHKRGAHPNEGDQQQSEVPTEMQEAEPGNICVYKVRL